MLIGPLLGRAAAGSVGRELVGSISEGVGDGAPVSSSGMDTSALLAAQLQGRTAVNPIVFPVVPSVVGRQRKGTITCPLMY